MAISPMSWSNRLTRRSRTAGRVHLGQGAYSRFFSSTRTSALGRSLRPFHSVLLSGRYSGLRIKPSFWCYRKEGTNAEDKSFQVSSVKSLECLKSPEFSCFCWSRVLRLVIAISDIFSRFCKIFCTKPSGFGKYPYTWSIDEGVTKLDIGPQKVIS